MRLPAPFLMVILVVLLQSIINIGRSEIEDSTGGCHKYLQSRVFDLLLYLRSNRMPVDRASDCRWTYVRIPHILLTRQFNHIQLNKSVVDV
jgi:hypothetical protein